MRTYFSIQIHKNVNKKYVSHSISNFLRIIFTSNIYLKIYEFELKLNICIDQTNYTDLPMRII